MVASLLRLLHSGPQDDRLKIKLKGNPEVKTFQWVLNGTGRLTTQWQRLDFLRVPDLNQTAVCRIPVKGELLKSLYLVVNLPDIATIQLQARANAGFAGPTYGWTNSIGHALIQSVTCEIGGNRMEQLDGRLLEILDEFNTPLEKVLTKNAMIKRVQNGYTSQSIGWDSTPTQCVIPLPFWFNRGDLASALPIDALNIDPVQVTVNFRPIQSLITSDSYVPNPADPTVEGSQWFPIQGSPFYKYDPNGSVVPGIGSGQKVSLIHGVTMPVKLSLGDTYFIAEYVYIDKPEANRFRINNLQYSISQHNTISPANTYGFPRIAIPMEIQNPVRHIYFYANRVEAAGYNAFFLGTRDLSGAGTSVPWWPNCSGLSYTVGELQPGFLKRDSEPFTSIELVYEGDYSRYSTENCALFRSILPSLEEKKSPWHNRFMYTIPMGIQSGNYPSSSPLGEANWSRLQKKELRLGLRSLNPGINMVSTNRFPRFFIYSWVETYNILKIYGGRATLLFGY